MKEGGRREYQGFPSENFCLKVQNTFVEDPLVILYLRVLKTVGYRRDGGGNHDFPTNFFCLIVPKHVVEEPFAVVLREFSGCQIIHW